MNTVLKPLVALLLLILTNISFAQTGQWTWMKGNTSANMPGVYGTLGVASQASNPGSRYGHYHWKDTSNNLHIFGGVGYNRSGQISFFNDFWKYSIGNNTWTWEQGDSLFIKPTVYGTRGQSTALNYPGARSFSASWTDSSNNFWIFGNGSTDFYSDLWKYNTISREWVWMKGDTLGNLKGVYGVKGVPAASNNPGGRWGSITWTDKTGNLWLFGGYGYAFSGGYLGNAYGFLNDLWKYNIVSNNWTWVSGDSIPWVRNSYNSRGVPSVANKPSSRHSGNGWLDPSGNSLWLFGGMSSSGRDTTGLSNDLWQYDIGSNIWTWISGDSVLNAVPVYGSKGIPATANKPGGQWNSSSCVDLQGKFWLFGGSGMNGINQENLNYLWKYDPTTGEWTW